MNKLFLSLLTKAMNTYLRFDPESTLRLQKLQGNVIAFELLPFHFTFQCLFNENGMVIVSDCSHLAKTTIRGTPLHMLGFALASDQRQQFFAEDIMIEGDAELGQQVIALFDELDIDWEEYASKIIGDIPAYHINRHLHQMSRWINKTKTTFAQYVNEYLHEEKTWFPTHEALQDLFRDIDTLRMDVDRIEARVTTLLREETE
ncbi:MAG: hypothetical protein A3F42_02115 [Gammaproteobacteria bacterium RIFCSPHIGHO2_12_FULL_37_34]|nr:MAG: hypothetical protein A3F42_02115 [Gammaproteobacteria bacterium RIFCSPHIGHO2_12_FULL_37_34]